MSFIEWQQNLSFVGVKRKYVFQKWSCLTYQIQKQSKKNLWNRMMMWFDGKFLGYGTAYLMNNFTILNLDIALHSIAEGKHVYFSKIERSKIEIL